VSEAGIAKFFAIARERYQIKLNRDAGLPKPWSQDPIFQKNRFCNVFREDDKTTVWFRENIRNKYRDDPEMALGAITTFRWFNKIEIGGVLKEALENESTLNDLRDQILLKYPEGPFVTGAYIIKTPDGLKKLDGVIWCLEEFNKKLQKGDWDKILSGKASMQETCGMLTTSPFLGRFTSYQICADAQYTCLLENAPDIYTWAQPGPGSTRGIGRVFYNDVNKFKYGSEKDEKQIIKHFVELIEYSKDNNYWPNEWPKWDAQTVQNQNCEHDKHCRAQEGGHMKRKF
jgi:hypothetical protein